MLEAIAEKGVKVRKAEVGLSFDFDDVKIKVLGPVAEYEDLNDMSVVLRVEYKENSFLFMGDAETSAEKGLLMQNEEALDADVLKVGHHGSKTSTSAKFLEAVDPRYGVICVGEGNSYGHPTPAIIKRLQDAGVVIYRTDESGSIVFYADGNTISVKCEK